MLGLKPWEFRRYTVTEFEEAVRGADMRYELMTDLIMRHALKTGQFSKPTSFRDLTGRDAPLPRDSRPRPPVDPEDAEKAARTAAFLAEHNAKMQSRNRDG